MTRYPRAFLKIASVSIAAVLLVACSKEEPKMPSGSTPDYRQVALEFTKSLAARDYAKAYQMTSQGYRKQMTVDQLRAAFEAIVPTDWGPMGPIEEGGHDDRGTWPGKQASDLGWVYVSIGGNVYSEAVTVITTSENGEAKIRAVEFGRP